MSWNLTVGPVHRNRFAKAAAKAVESLGGPEREQADRAVQAAAGVVESGVAGDAGIRVLLAGHTSPGHVGLADGGDADPHVTIAVAHVPLDQIRPDDDDLAEEIAEAVETVEDSGQPATILGVPVTPPAAETPGA